MKNHAWALFTAGCLLSVSLPGAQIIATDTAEAGPDFPYQGEYIGDVTVSGGKTTRLAAQVSAFGNGSFRGVFYTGNFPGYPGHVAASRVQIMGTRSGEKVSFSGSGYALSLTRSAITGTGPNQASVTLPRIVRSSPTLGLKPPAEAVVLFGDGKDVSLFRAGAKVDSRGLLSVPATTVATYGSYSLHLEVLLPFQPEDRGQARSNSGIIMNTGGFSEVQVLDSFGDAPYSDGCGGLYGAAAPLVHANLPPLTWQTYDINFTAPATTGDATITVRINGVVVQDRTVLRNRRSATTLELQDHTDPVFYRNVWLVKRDDYDFARHVALTITPRTSGERPGIRQGTLSGGGRILREGRAVIPGPRVGWNGLLLDLMGRRDAFGAPAAP